MKVFHIVLFALFFSMASLHSDTGKVFVRDLKVTGSLTSDQKKKWENLLVIHILGAFSNSIVMTDDSLSILLKQLKTNQKITGDSELFEYLAQSLEFEDLIQPELLISSNQWTLTLQWIRLNKKSGSGNLVHLVSTQFHPMHTDLVLREAVFALQKKIPLSIENMIVTPSEINILPKENHSFVPEKLLTIENSELPLSFLEGIRNYVSIGDTLFKEQEYAKSRDVYKKVLLSIDSLRDGTEKKILPITLSIQKRYKESNRFYFQERIRKLDKDFSITKLRNESEWLLFTEAATGEWKDYSSIPEYSKPKELEKYLLNRLYIAKTGYWSFQEKKSMEHFRKLEFQTAESLMSKLFVETCRSENSMLDEDYSNQIKNKLQFIKQSATSYLENQVSVFNLLAESENSRSVLEKQMEKPEESHSRLDNSMQYIDKSKTLIQEHKKYIKFEIIQNTNSVIDAINKNKSTQKIYNWKTISNLPIQYLYNIARGVSDLFVFRFGVGFGVGAEAWVLGASPAMYAMGSHEISTGYGMHEYEKGKKKGSPVSAVDKNLTDGEGVFLGYSGAGVINCIHFGLRLCTTDKKMDWKKYSNVQVTGAFLLLVQVNVETHGFLELPLIFLGMDPDLLDLSSYKKPRKKYFRYDEVSKVK
jgi:hypothetical protein